MLDAVRTRARRGYRTETGRLSGISLSPDQRSEIGLLLGTRWEVSSQPVNLRTLAARLAEHDLSVRELVELVDGRPIEENRTLRERAEAAAAAERAQAAATVWRRLPRAGTHVRLARLAADVLHNAHALDASEPAGRAIARLSAAAHGLERPQRGGPTWREAWAAVGVQCDGVSSRVLALNLPLSGTSPAARLCSAATGLTLRSLSGAWAMPSTTVFVCENPTVVEAAADLLGLACPPLVCTDGIASGAAIELITGLAAHGCPIMVRADIDPAGCTIVEQVLTAAPAAQLWRFDATTYASELGFELAEARPQRPTETVSQLRDIYRTHQVSFHEEQILDTILRDLSESTMAWPTGAQSGR